MDIKENNEKMDEYDDQYYSQNAEELKDPVWTAITTAAAEKIFIEEVISDNREQE